jgi:hypothetical protein
MIEIEFFSNDDELSRQKWPTEVYQTVSIGDIVDSKYAMKGRVCRIVHRYHCCPLIELASTVMPY